MKARIRVAIALLMISAGSLSGQAPDSAVISLGYPVYSQYLQNGYMINPAYAGTRGSLSAFISYRRQWMGIQGSPQLQSFSLHTPLKSDKIGLGLMAQFMSYGHTKSTSIYASYAYHIKLKNGKLSFGLKGGFDRSNTDFTNIRLTKPGDPVFTSTDKPYLLPNVSAGVYYSSGKVFAGLAIPSFLGYTRTSSGTAQAFHSFDNYDFMITGGGLITLSPLLKLKPSFLLDYSLHEGKKLTQLDINANLIITDMIWVGGSWRTTEKVAVGILQIQINPQLMAGFSYDFPASRMKTYSNGSSEFILRYEFGYKVSASNPRYF
jgi:type IX secretion system PorP/SprF family membrane protein